MNLIEENPAEEIIGAGTLELSDPSEFEVAVRPWDIICSPLDKRPFAYRMAYVTTPAFTFYRETYGSSVSLKGAAPPGMLAFAVPLALGAGTEFWKRRLERPGLPGTLPGGLDVVMTQGQDHIVVLIALDRLHWTLTPEQISRIETAAHERLLPSTHQNVLCFGRWLLSRLDQLCHAPELLRESRFRSSLELELIQQTADAICVEESRPAMRPSSSSRRRALERAVNFLYGNNAALLTVPELSQIAGASQRTLEYAFRETFDMSPRAFLIQRRLHAARRDLISVEPNGPTTVGEIANANGFYELGRFAGEYKRAFGELPSETLRAKFRIRAPRKIWGSPSSDFLGVASQ